MLSPRAKCRRSGHGANTTRLLLVASGGLQLGCLTRLLVLGRVLRCFAACLQDIAARIKKKFDSSYPSTTWHCIVGNHFAVSITHQTKYLCFLDVAGQSVLLFKSQE